MKRELTTILAIDDNNDNLITIKALIGESFPEIKVVTAQSGEAGIKLALELKPDVILLDVVMPGMDGFEVGTKLKENELLSDIPVIFVTALKADKESRIRALEIGAEGFLAKPIDESELVAQIRAMLKIRQASVEKQSENVRLSALVAERTKELKLTHTATLNLLEDLRNENEARRQTAEALAESQSRLIRAEFASKSGNWELHLDSKIMISSEGACSLYGISEKENEFDIVKEVPLPEYREKLDKALQNLIEKDEPYSMEFKIKKVNSGEIVDIHSIAFFDKERRIVFGVIQNITERKQAQKALYESEALYRSVINASPDNITVTDLSGKILMISPNGLKLTGYEDETLLLGRNIHEFLAADDQIRADKNINAMFQGIFNGSEEYGLVRADGTIVDTEINAEFVKDVNGEPKGLVFAIRDIQERKLAQDTIRESERKYRLITEKISDVVWILDMSGKSMFVSQSVENFTGYTVDEYLAQTIRDRFTPESAQIAAAEMKASMELLQHENFETEHLAKILMLDYVCKDGSIKTGELLITPYLDDNNQLVGVHGVTRDVTERKRAEDSLRISEEKYRFMAENSSDVIWHMGTDFIFDYVSPAQERLDGYKPEEIVGKSLWNLLQPEDIDKVKNTVIRNKSKKEKTSVLSSFKFEFEVPTRAGALIWVEVSVSIHIDDDGTVIGYHGVTRDITERKNAQKELGQSEEKYRLLVENSPNGIAIYQEGKFVYVNRTGLKIFGVDKDSYLLGKPILSIVHPDSMDTVVRRVSQVSSGGHVPPLEEKLIRFDGSVFDAEVTALGTTFNGKSAGQVIVNDITERKIAAERLKESEEKFRDMANLLPQVIFEIDLTGKLTYVNRHAYSLFGYENEELIGMNSLFVHRPSEWERVKDGIRKKLSGIAIDNKEFTMIRKDGSSFPALIYINIIERDGVASGVRGVVIDITEQKDSERLIRESEEKYRDMANLLPQVVFETNLAGEITYVNQQANILFRYDGEELIGMNSLLVHVQDERQRVKDGITASMAWIPVENREFTMLRKDGTTFPGLLYINPIIKQNEPIGLRGLVVDITEHKKSQQALQESEALYRAILEASPDFITITDVNGYVVKVSPSNVRRYGYKYESEVLGRNISEFIVEEDRERMFNDFSLRVKDGVKTGPNEYKALMSDGSSFDLEVNGGLIRNSAGEIVQFVSIARDVTERKAVQDALLESENRYNNFINNNVDMIFVKDEQCKYLVANDSMARFYGKTSTELLGKTDLELGAGDFISPCSSSDMRALATDIPFVIEEKLGDRIYETLKFPMQLRNNKKGIGGILRDITDRKMAEEKLNYVTRLYALLSHVNEAIVRIKEEDVLLKTICELAIEYGQFRMCWIGVYDEISNRIIPYAFAGNVDGYFEKLHIEPGDPKYGGGPTGRAFSEGKLMYCNNIKTDPIMASRKGEALKRGFQSSFSLPLYRKQQKFGTLTLYASVINSFNEEEQKLLSEIGHNISYAIEAIVAESDRKQAEAALIQSEAKYRDFVENSPEAIAIYSDNVVTYVNKECLRLMRANSKEDLIGMPVIDFIHPDNRQLVVERMMKVAVSEIDVSLPLVEEKYIRLDGTPIYVEVKVMPLMLDGKPAFQLTARDISDRKIIEGALEQSRIELKAIYDNAPVMMCVVDKNREILFANNAFNALNGISDDIIKKGAVGGVIGCINSFDSPKGCGHGSNCNGCSLRIAMENTFNTGVDHKNVEYQSVLQIGGELKEVYLLGSTALIQTGVHNSLLLCLHDITDRKVAEDALYKSEMILRTFIDNIPFDIWARDVNTVGILENKKMVAHFGSIIGKKTAEIDRSEDEIQLYNSINERAFKGDIVDDEYELFEHGLPKYYRQIVFPIYDRTKVSGIASINIDITERKQFEKALDESQEQLKKFAAHLQSVREEERLLLAREIHDELGQILIAMKIDMGLLRQYVMKNVVDNAYTQTVEKFNGLLSLVDNTIQTARRIMTDLRPEVLDLLGFVDTVKQYAAKYEERHKIGIKFYATDLPVTINPDQSVALFRIVQEALNNISKHAKATEISINIDVVKTNYVVEIIDNGVGFDMNKKSRSDSYGLIGMKERVFLLGATLNIHSEIGKGTSIRVEVPKSDGESVMP